MKFNTPLHSNPAITVLCVIFFLPHFVFSQNISAELKKGRYRIIHNNTTSADTLAQLNELKNEAIESQSAKTLAEIGYNMALIEANRKNYVEALPAYVRAIENLPELEPIDSLMIYNDLAIGHIELNEYGSATKYIIGLEQLYLRYPDKTKHLVEKLTPIDELYAQAKMYNEAINWLNKLRDKKLYLDKSKPEAYTEQLITVANYAYLNNQLDTAMELYNKAYAIVESAAFENRDFLLGKIQGKQALVYLSQQEYEATIPLFKAEFLELLRKKDSVACARNLNNLAIAEKETKDYENALRHLQYIKTLVSIEEHPDILHQQLKLTSAVYGELKQYDSAFFYGSRYTALTDSLQISQAEKNASLVQLSNRLEQKEMMLENALLQEYKQRKLSSEILLTRNVAFAGVVLITLILIYVLYNLIKRNQQKHQLEKLIVDFENKAFQLQESLTQKETLIKEVHHRVKNNLQIVSGILQLQAMHVKGDQIKDFIKKSQNRIHSMSLIHQLLYQNQNLNKISIKEYINKLVMQLFMQYHVNPNRIQTNYYVPDIDINVDDAINIGLILNELITNVICHAYPDEEKGHLDIWLKHVKDNTYKLIIADDGPGLTGAIDEVENVGLKLAGLLVNQIKSKLHYTYNNGAEFHFTFNLKK